MQALHPSGCRLCHSCVRGSKMQPELYRAARWAALTIAVCASAWAQNITGSIVGVVKAPAGAAVPGACVTIHNTGTGAATQVATDASGTYSAPNLLAGTYDVDRK